MSRLFGPLRQMGYVVRDIRALLALFSSPLVLEWLARAGVPLRGDYRRLKTAFLSHTRP